MTTETDDRSDQFPTLGVEAIALDRYSAIESKDELIIYDEGSEDAWIQSNDWITVTGVG